MHRCESLCACGQGGWSCPYSGRRDKVTESGIGACPLSTSPHSTAQPKTASPPLSILPAQPEGISLLHSLCPPPGVPDPSWSATGLGVPHAPGSSLFPESTLNHLPSMLLPFPLLGMLLLVLPQEREPQQGHPAASPSGSQSGGCLCVWEPGGLCSSC